jgi:hypothetical protein
VTVFVTLSATKGERQFAKLQVPRSFRVSGKIMTGGTMKRHIISIVAALALLATLTGVALAGQKELPFKGTLQAVETLNFTNPPIMTSTASGWGNATHLGQYTLSWEVEVNLETITGTGTGHFVAANGDSLYTVGTGQATPTDEPDVFRVIENMIITGGTGRFAGASGNFTTDRIVDLTTGVTSGTISGTIELP